MFVRDWTTSNPITIAAVTTASGRTVGAGA